MTAGVRCSNLNTILPFYQIKKKKGIDFPLKAVGIKLVKAILSEL